MSTIKDLLARLEHWQDPDGLDFEPRQVVEPAFIRFSGKHSLSAKKMALGNSICEKLLKAERGKTKLKA